MVKITLAKRYSLALCLIIICFSSSLYSDSKGTSEDYDKFKSFFENIIGKNVRIEKRDGSIVRGVLIDATKEGMIVQTLEIKKVLVQLDSVDNIEIKEEKKDRNGNIIDKTAGVVTATILGIIILLLII